MRAFVLLFVAVCCGSADAATHQVPSCTRADVQAAINAAASGDTVVLPSPCVATWTSPVVIPSTKGITLNGNGATVTGGIQITPHASVSTRVTGFTFTSNTDVFETFGTSLSAGRWRFDHNTLTGSGTSLLDLGPSPGVLDHNRFTSLGGSTAPEFIHIWGWSAGSTVGWSNDHLPGSDEAIYIEDNEFTVRQPATYDSWIQSYYGARVVLRYNTIAASIDAHGTAGMVGARWWEIYGNTFIGQSYGVNNRAGSGVVFNNTGVGQISFCEEDSGYPAAYQIGRGKNQALYPAYVFGNGTMGAFVDECDAPEVVGMVRFDRDVFQDYGARCAAGGACLSGVGVGSVLPTSCSVNSAFWKTNAGGNWHYTNATADDGALYKCVSSNTWALYYTPYPYPHPLVDSSRDHAPTSVRVLSSSN
jgi:hypothetical protein